MMDVTTDMSTCVDFSVPYRARGSALLSQYLDVMIHTQPLVAEGTTKTSSVTTA